MNAYQLVAPCGVIAQLNSRSVRIAQQRSGNHISLAKEEGIVSDGDIIELQVFSEGTKAWSGVSWRLAASFQKWRMKK